MNQNYRLYRCQLLRGSLFLASLIFFTSSLREVRGQAFFSEASSEFSSRINPPREIERLLTQAESAIKNRAWSEASKSLGLVLGIEADAVRIEGQGQDYFRESEMEADTARATIHERALELFDSIPEEGQATVELRYGVSAKQQLDQAIATGDWQRIDAIASRYLMTEVGRQASFLAAEHQMALGNPAWAAWRWQQLLRYRRAREQFGPVLGVASASAWLAAGNETRAREVLADANVKFANKEVSVGSVRLSLANQDETIQKLRSADLKARSEKQTSPNVIGGAPDRNADSLAGLPLPFVSWHSLLHESLLHENDALKTMQEQSKKNEDVSLIPSRSSIVVPPYVIAMTYDQRVHAVHMRTGQLKWATPFAGASRESDNVYPRREFSSTKLPIVDYLAKRIWGQQATGQLTSDDQNIYVVVEQASVDAAESLRRGANASITVPIPQKNFNVLQAYSIKREASLAWEVGGEEGLSEPLLANVLFLGPPLPYDGQLLIIGEVNGELILYSVDPNNGHLLWKQQLAANSVSTIAADVVRRNFACSPAVHAGVVVCPTLSGELVAVDLASRSLRWSTRYAQNSESRGNDRINVFGIAPNRDFKPLEARSSETSVVIGDGVVIHAPPDGKGLSAIDLHSGVSLWNSPNSEVLYIVAVLNSTVVFASHDAVTCLNLQTGERVWNIDVSEYGKVAGRSARNNDQIFIPTTSQAILQVNAQEGKVVDVVRAEKPLGNLVATADSLISLGPVVLASYPIRDQVRLQLQNELASNQQSPLLLARRAELAVGDSDWEAAFDFALQAYEAAPENDEIKSVVRKVGLAVLKEDFKSFEPRFEKLNALMEEGPNRSQYVASLVRALLLRESYDAALGQLLELTELKRDAVKVHSGYAETIDLEEHWSIREEEWIASTLATLLQKASPEMKAEAVEQVKSILQKSISSIDESVVLDLHFRYVPQASPYFLVRAIQAYRAGDLLDAEIRAVRCESLAQLLEDKAEADRLTLASKKLRVMLYNEVGRVQTAAKLALTIGIPVDRINEIDEVSILADGALSEFASFSPVEKVASPSRIEEEFGGSIWLAEAYAEQTYTPEELEAFANSDSQEWPQGKVVVSKENVSVGDMRFAESVCRINTRIGDALQGWTVRMMPSSIDLVDAAHRRKISIPSNSGFTTNQASAYMVYSILIVEQGGELTAIDTLAAQKEASSGRGLESDFLDSSTVLWQEQFGRANTGRLGIDRNRRNETLDWGAENSRTSIGFTTLVADPFGLIVATDKTIQCKDFRSGEVIWTVNVEAMKFPGSNRSGFASQPYLTFDNGILTAIDAVGRTRVNIKASTGAVDEIGTFESSGSIWLMTEGKFLTGRKTSERKYEFQLFNAQTGESLLKLETPGSSRAELLDDTSLAIWGPDQELEYWNLKSAERFSYPLVASSRINQIRLERFENVAVLMSYVPSKKLEFVQDEAELDSHIVAGEVLAIDIATGKPVWEKPLDVYHFHFPVRQPRISPAMVLVRQLNLRLEANRRIKLSSVAFIDLKTGKLLYQNDYLPTQQGIGFASSVFPSQHILNINYRSATLNLQWTSEASDDSKPTVDIGNVSAATLIKEMPEELREYSKALQEAEDAGTLFE